MDLEELEVSLSAALSWTCSYIMSDFKNRHCSHLLVNSIYKYECLLCKLSVRVNCHK